MPKSIVDQFVDWLDPYVIAEAVKKELGESGGRVTLERMKATWLECLGGLNSFIWIHIP